MTKRVLIIGLGLIGGSIGLAIKREKDAVIAGYDLNKEQLKLAQSLQVIDIIAESLQTEAELADYIFISTPVLVTEKIINELSKMSLKNGVIITDVGSTKKEIVDQSRIFNRNGIYFIGGHPMAGSHKSGVSAAKAHLFENAFYILTPTENVPETKIKELKELLKGTKANFIEMPASEHDEIASVISHFPHIIAASLVHNLASFKESELDVSRFAAGGFRDITRIASSNPTMWRDILLQNRNPLLKLFQNWLEEMRIVEQMIEEKDGEKIYQYFKKAKSFRDGLPVQAKGAIPAFYDLFVDVPDYPGVISEVTGILATYKISITNIRIIEAREDIYGVLRLSFQTENDRSKAMECLQSNGYETYISS